MRARTLWVGVLAAAIVGVVFAVWLFGTVAGG